MAFCRFKRRRIQKYGFPRTWSQSPGSEHPYDGRDDIDEEIDRNGTVMSYIKLVDSIDPGFTLLDQQALKDIHYGETGHQSTPVADNPPAE